MSGRRLGVGLVLVALTGAAWAQRPSDLLTPPPASVCVAPTAPTESGNVHMFPGRWWNPQRNGIGWDFFYNDGQSTMYLTWFTYDPAGRPVWLHGAAQPLKFNAVTGERTWQSQLHAMRWTFNANGPIKKPVGAVSVTFPNQTTTRAVVRWRWDAPNTDGSSGIAPVGGLTYDECIFDTFRDQRSLQPGRGTINQAFSSNWFYQGVPNDPLVGWGVDLLVDLDPASGSYFETSAAAIFDVSGRPTWLQSQDDWGTSPPPDDTLSLSGKGALRYFRYTQVNGLHPAVTVCDGTSTSCGPDGDHDATAGLDSYGQFARRIDGAASGRMRLTAQVPADVTGIGAIDWPPPPGVQDPDLAAEVPVMRFDANHIIVDKSVCRVATPNDACTFTVSWSSNDPGATIRRLDLNNGGAPTNFAYGLSSFKTDPLPVGARVQYEISYRYNGSGPPTTLRTPEVRVLLDGVIADANVEDFSCEAGTAPGCERPRHDPTTGAIAGEAATEGGAAVYSIPIVVPPGRNGMQPELSLRYNSRGGNGIAGLGWSLSGLSAIHRCPRTAAEDGVGNAAAVSMSANDALCLDGERLVRSDANGVPTTGGYGARGAYYRTEINNFARVTQYGGDLTSAATCFKVEHKSGRVDYFGGVPGSGSPGAATCNGGNSRQIPGGGIVVAPLSWQIERSEDPSGNAIDYSYSAAEEYGAGEKLLRYINYTSKGNDPGTRQVFFDYKPRPDADRGRSYMAGGRIERTQRLERIVTSVDGITVNTYSLTYTDPISRGEGNLHSGRSALQRIKQCANGGEDNAGNEVCLPETVVSWADLPPDHVLRPLQVAGLPDAAPAPGGSFADRAIDPVGDLDGDGVREVLVRQFEADGNRHFWLVKQNADRAVQGKLDISALVGSLVFVPDGMQADFDGDGRSDLLTVAAGGGSLSLYRWNLARGANFGADVAATFNQVVLSDVPRPSQLLSTSDIDGDGYADLLVRRQGTRCSGNQTEETESPPGAPPSHAQIICYHRNTTPSTNAVSFAAGVPVYTWSHQYAAGGLQAVGDLNGDGAADFVIENDFEQGTDKMPVISTVLLSQMPGLSLPAGCAPAPASLPVLRVCDAGSMNLPTLHNNGYRVFGVARRWHDVNGDGLSDLLYALPGSCTGAGHHCGRGSWHVQIANGRGFDAPLAIAGGDEALLMTSGMRQNRLRYAVQLPTADADSDGKSDLLFPVALAARHCAATQMSYETSSNDISCPAYDYEPPGGGGRALLGQSCSEIVWVCGNDPAADLGGPATYGLPTRESLPNTAAHTTDNLYSVRTHMASFAAEDRSLYYMAGLRFVATQSGYAAQVYSLDASAGSNRAAHRVAMTLDGSASTNAANDLYGDGLGDPTTRVGCSGSSASATVCRYVGDGTTGPASFATGPAPNAPPVMFNVTDLNNGLRTFVNENVGVAENTASAPTLPGLVRAVVNGLGETSTWTYFPLSSRGKRSASQLPLYQIPSDGYADSSHFYFQSTMPVVGSMTSSTGTDALLGARSWRYGYAEAMYNRLGRGFQGFRAILREQVLMSGDVSRALREVTLFHQKFPLTGRTELTRSGRANPSPNPALNGLKDWVLPFTEEVMTWGCLRAAPASCPTAGAPAATSFAYPFLHEQVTTQFDPDPLELAVPVLRRSSEVVRRNYAGSGSAATTGWDDYGNLTFSETESRDFAEAAGAIAFVDSKRSRSVASYANQTGIGVWRLGELASADETVFAMGYGAAHPLPADVILPEQTLHTAYEWNPDRTPHSVTVSDADPTVYSRKVFSYPQNAADNYGLPIAIAETLSDGTASGRVTRTAQTVYGDKGYFPKEQFDAAGLKTETEYRARDGQIRKTVLPTGVKTRHSFDAFGRIFRSETYSGSDLSPTLLAQPVYRSMNGCPGVGCAGVGDGGRMPGGAGLPAEYYARYRVTTVQNGSPTQVTWHDMLGREIKSAVRGFDGTFVATLTEYDALGMPAAKSVPFFLSGPTATAPFAMTFNYDRAGRLVRKTAPDGESAAGQAASASRHLISSYGYSGNRSTVQISRSGGGACPANVCISVARYNGVAGLMRTDDALGGVTRYWTDAAGRPAAIANANTNAAYPGAIPAGQVTRAVYDKLGRRTQASDPDQGSWSFVYNGAGELVSQTDARQVVTAIQRDAAGRPQVQTSSLPATQGAAVENYRDEWTYLPTTGLLDEMRRCISGSAIASCPGSTATWRESYVYQYGRLLSASTTQQMPQSQSLTQATIFHYDANYGREKAVEYPSTLKVQRIYTRYGALRDVLDADTGERFWGVGAVDAWGNVTRQDYGNGMVGEYTYDPLSGRAVSLQWRSSSSTQPLVADRIDYAYDPLGNLAAQRRVIPGVLDATESYSYDRLQRLAGSSVPGAGQAVGYDYDALGNLKRKTDFSRDVTDAYRYAEPQRNGCGPNVATTILMPTGVAADRVSYHCDSNGNVVKAQPADSNGTALGGARQVRYDASNRPRQISDPGAPGSPTALFLYAPDGRRVYEALGERYYPNPGGTSVSRSRYIVQGQRGYQLELASESPTSTSRIERHELGGVSVVLRNVLGQAQVREVAYKALDRIGSPLGLMDDSGQFRQRSESGTVNDATTQMSFTAFGTARERNFQPRTPAGDMPGRLNLTPATRQGFTGHEHLDSLGLIHMNGRVYDHRAGRFLSVDPFIQFPANSQSLNPYSYIMNNPMAGTDPTGYRIRRGRQFESGEARGGKASCMGDALCQSQQAFDGPVNDFRNSLKSAAVRKAAWNGKESSSVIPKSYKAVEKIEGITYYDEPVPGMNGDQSKEEDLGLMPLEIVGAVERRKDATNTFRVKSVDYLTSTPQEDLVDFTIRAGKVLVGYAEKTGFEHCYRVCGSDSPGTPGKPDFEAKVVTIGSHVGCGASPTMCSSGYVDFGYQNHSHGSGAFRVNRIDVQVYEDLRLGARVSDQDRYLPSPEDYERKRGFLSTPAGVIWHGEKGDPLVPIEFLRGN